MKKITEDKILVLIICCWALLIICFLIKIFGGNWFEIVVTNQNFMNFCNFVDKRIYLKILVFTIVYCFSGIFIFAITTKQKLLKDPWYILLCIPCSYIKYKFKIFGLIYDLVLLIIIPIIVLYKNNKSILKSTIRTVLVVVVMSLFQQISLNIKNESFYLFNETNTFIPLILQIDYYIMFILCYLHMRRFYKMEEVS